MTFQKTNFLFIKNELEKSTKSYPCTLEPIFIDYLKKYNSISNFLDISFIIKKNKSILYCPITIETNSDGKKLNFFGEPFFIICENKDKELLSLFYKKIQDIMNEKKINKINFLISKKFENFESGKIISQNSLNKITLIKYFDLSLDIQNIKKDFSKGHKSAIKKEYDELEYKIIDFKNYNNDITDMMNMHYVVAQKITRSKETWLLNGEMIKNNNGFLIKVIYKKKTISFSLFFFNNEEAIYFSSCTDRNYFKDFINITHKSIYHSINYLKNNGCKKLTLGECKTIYSSEVITQKEKNIQKFKSSFGGDIYINFYLKKLDPDLINLYLK